MARSKYYGQKGTEVKKMQAALISKVRSSQLMEFGEAKQRPLIKNMGCRWEWEHNKILSF